MQFRLSARARVLENPSRLPIMFAILAGALLPTLAAAQEAAEESEEVVVTAPLEGSRIESLQGATTLTRDDIVQNLNGGLGDTLDAQPGVASTFFGAGASRPIIRGLGEDRVRVLQNGIGAIDASTASPDHAVTSDGLDAERIEVLRGAAALAYGGNAIGGVVNVIDQSIPTTRHDALRFEGLAAYSSVDNGMQGAGELGFDAGPLAIHLTAASRQSDSYETPIGEATNQWVQMANYGAGAALVRDWGFAGLAVKRSENDYGLLPEGPGESGGHIEMEQTRVESRGDFRLRAGLFNRLDYGVQHSDYRHTEFEADGTPGTTFFSEGYEARLEAHHRGERLRGALGLQHTDVDLSAEGDEAFITASNTRDSGAFVIERYDRGRWGLEGGLRYEQRNISNAAAGARSFDTRSGSLGAFVRPAEGWFIGATAARTERAPTAIELFSDGPHLATANYERGDPDLVQERATSFEISSRFNSARTTFEANLFAIDFANYIALVGTDLVWYSDASVLPDEGIVASDDPILAALSADAVTLPVFQSVQRDASFVGGELSLRSALFDLGAFRIGSEIALDIVNASFDGGGRPPRIPPRSLTVGVTAESANWTARVEAVDTAKQDRIAAFETPTQGYTFLNASLAWRPGGYEGRWSIRVDGRNLTDELGRVHTSFLKDELPLPGRAVRVTVAANF